MATLRAIADGSVTRAFRRWDVPRVRPGGRQRTALGVVRFDAVKAVGRASLTEDDARAAGIGSLDDLLEMLERRDHGAIYRVDLHMEGPDPRVGLRASIPDEREIGDILQRLTRLDRASHHGPWTHAILRAIGEGEGVPAAELAASFGRERAPFKLDVRKLKELGLTESLRPGYRLSPRGRTVLAAVDGERRR